MILPHVWSVQSDFDDLILAAIQFQKLKIRSLQIGGRNWVVLQVVRCQDCRLQACEYHPIGVWIPIHDQKNASCFWIGVFLSPFEVGMARQIGLFRLF